MNYWYNLDSNQTRYLVDILDNPQVLESISQNDWYINFVHSIRYDIIKKQCISEKQLYHIKKLSAVNEISWRLVI